MENINFSPQASQIHHTEHISVLGITKNKCYDIFPSCLKFHPPAFALKETTKTLRCLPLLVVHTEKPLKDFTETNS